MAQVPVPFGEWRPDVATLDGQFTTVAENVYVGSTSYLPMAGLAAITASSLSSGGNDSFTKVFLRMEGASSGTTFTDIAAGAASSHTWTAAGNAVTDITQSKFGVSSMFCDGTGDWISSADSTDYTIGTSSTTIDCFVRPATAGTLMYIAGQGNASSSAASTSFLLRKASSGVFECLLSNGSTFTTVSTTTPVSSGTFVHVAVCLDRSFSSNNFGIYLNGTREGLGSFTGTVPDSANNYRVGAGGELTTTPMNGHIDEYRHDIGVARYGSSGQLVTSFTTPTAAYFQGGPTVGLAAARTSSGSYKIFGGTRTKLFTWAAAGWSDVTRASGGAYSVAAGDLWRYAQFGSFVYATQISDTLQRIEVNTGTNFAAVPGSPPQARSVAVVGPFLVLGGLISNQYKIQWCALEDPTGWTIGTSLSDEQEFVGDGGPVQGVAGGEGMGYVVRDRAIHSMQWLPGDTTTIFSFSRVAENVGSVSKYGFVSVNNILYVLDVGGFFALAGNQMAAIGAEKVDQWFFANSDPARLNQVLAFTFVKRPRIGWAFYKSAGSDRYDGLMIYDVPMQKWSYASITADIWAQLASTGVDLDTSTGETGDPLLDSSAPSLDSAAYIGGAPSTGATVAGVLSFLDGVNLPARIETGEAHLAPGQRAFVNRIYPLVDATSRAHLSTFYYKRESLQTPAIPSTSLVTDITGWVPILDSARLFKFSQNIAAGAIWTQAQGLMVDVQPDGDA